MTRREAPLVALLVLSCGPLPLPAEPIPGHVPRADVQRTAGPIVVDGVLDEPSWAAAPMIDGFVFPWYTSGARDRTEAHLLWDDEALYVAFRAFDPTSPPSTPSATTRSPATTASKSSSPPTRPT